MRTSLLIDRKAHDEKYLKVVFCILRMALSAYRRQMGGRFRGFKVLLLTTTGRKSGKTNTLPLGCFDHKDGYVIVASNRGLPTNPAWYHNLKSNPRVTVQVMDKVLSVTAEELSGEARAQAWQQVITTAPSYAEYEKKTTREIPLFLLRPGQ